jgi:hypothetical protein
VARVAALLLAAVMSCACVTHPPVSAVPPDHLDQIPVGSRITVVTRDGRSVTMKVTEASADRLAGIDQRYRVFGFRRDEVEQVTVASQNDTVIMLAWVAVIFATGL